MVRCILAAAHLQLGQTYWFCFTKTLCFYFNGVLFLLLTNFGSGFSPEPHRPISFFTIKGPNHLIDHLKWRSISLFRFILSLPCSMSSLTWSKSHPLCHFPVWEWEVSTLVSMSWPHPPQTLGKEGSSRHVKNLVKPRGSGDHWSNLLRSHVVRRQGNNELRMYRVFISGRVDLRLYVHISIYTGNGDGQSMGRERCVNTLTGAWECPAPLLSLLPPLSLFPLVS